MNKIGIHYAYWTHDWDADVLSGVRWKVRVRAFDAGLKLVRETTFDGKGAIDGPRRVGNLDLDWEQTRSCPLFVVTDVIRNGRPADRAWYFVNYEYEKGCLFTRPATRLRATMRGRRVCVANAGKRPAIAVNVAQPGHLDTFTVTDNYFWLDAGEERTVEVNCTRALRVSAWNA
jgi:hypothetical protein